MYESTQVYEWTENFKNGVTSVEDSPRPGPAFTPVTEDNIAAVENVTIRLNRGTLRNIVLESGGTRRAKGYPRPTTNYVKRHYSSPFLLLTI